MLSIIKVNVQDYLVEDIYDSTFDNHDGFIDISSLV